MAALAPRAEADWTGSASGSQTYDDIANWNGGAGPINDPFIRINNSGFVLNFNNDRTAGLPNTGGGGGGGTQASGGKGGTGIVIIRYVIPPPTKGTVLLIQ